MSATATATATVTTTESATTAPPAGERTVSGWRLRAYPTPDQEAKLLAWSAAGAILWNDLAGWWRRGMRIGGPRTPTVKLPNGMTIVPAISRKTWLTLAGTSKRAAKPFRNGGYRAVKQMTDNPSSKPAWAQDVPAGVLHGVGADFDQAVAAWWQGQHDKVALDRWRQKRIRRGRTPFPKRFYGAPRFQAVGERLSVRWQEQGDPLRRTSERRGALQVIGFRGLGLGGLEVHLDAGYPAGATIKSVRITRDAEGLWWVGLSIETVRRPAKPARHEAVGLDRGVVIPVAVSRGADLRVIPGLKPGEQRRLHLLERRIARIHRQVSPECHAPGKRCTGKCPFSRTTRDETGNVVSGPSKNLLELHHQVTKLQAREVRRRQQARHTFTRRIVDTYNTIALEDLHTRAMTGTAKGSVDDPGRKVAQKRGLNRSISRVGWQEIERQLEYKAKWSGRTVAKVPAAYTSMTCSACYHVNSRRRTSQARFQCEACGLVMNADRNAARVIEWLGAGTCPDTPRRPGEEAAETDPGGSPGEAAEAASGTRKDRAPHENMGTVHQHVDPCEQSSRPPSPRDRSQTHHQEEHAGTGYHCPDADTGIEERSHDGVDDLVSSSGQAQPSGRSTCR